MGIGKMMALGDRAASICPVGVILPQRRGFAIPIGRRRYDAKSVAEQVSADGGTA